MGSKAAAGGEDDVRGYKEAHLIRAMSSKAIDNTYEW